jgi:hypothetical protein
MITMRMGGGKGAFCADVREGRVALRMDEGLARIDVWERGRLREAQELEIRFREGDPAPPLVLTAVTRGAAQRKRGGATHGDGGDAGRRGSAPAPLLVLPSVVQGAAWRRRGGTTHGDDGDAGRRGSAPAPRLC